MKILTWNINGIRGNKGFGLKQLLDSLDADVICLQETKVSREQLDEASAIVDGYNAYFSFSRARAGYSGVATFVRDCATPFKAEDGIAGLANEEKEELCIGHLGDHSSYTDEELESLDREGRCVMTQHFIRNSSGIDKDLIIINVYCPRAEPGNEVRKSYKMRFYQLLQSRAEAILKSGRHVIVLGDINTSHRKIDHCDPANDEEFFANPGRKWLDNFLFDSATDDSSVSSSGDTNVGEEHHLFVDTFRLLHPDQLNAFTNWSSATGARETNYGCRLDYIFADKILAQDNFKECFIMPDVMGSDHCPVKAVLDCSAVASKKCPPLCTKYMPQFSGKQQKLSMFLIRSTKPKSALVDSDSVESSQTSSSCDLESVVRERSCEDLKLSNESDTSGMVDSLIQTGSDANLDFKYIIDSSPSEDLNLKTIASDDALSISHKRLLPNSKKIVGVAAKKSKVESLVDKKQGNLLNFFAKNSVGIKKNDNGENRKSIQETTGFLPENEIVDSKLQTICNGTDCNNEKAKNEVDESECAEPLKSDANNFKMDSKSAASEASNSATTWKSLFKGPPQTPLCKGHKEPCALRVVKKPGPNKGKQFWTCNRPEGHKTNPDARCDYFVWVSNKK